jgi:hypothetical protein
MSNPINIYNSKIGIHNPYFDSTNYVYQLDIFFKNNSKKTFNKITNKKYTRLIQINDKINFNTISHFILVVTKDIGLLKQQFTIEGDLKLDELDELDEFEDYTYKTDELYIEFNKNDLNLIDSCCYVKGIDDNRLFITPPNY